MSKKHSTLDHDFIVAFRQGQTGAAREALDRGANPPHDIVHDAMLGADPHLAAATYADMWKLYFEMRGPLGDAEEVASLSGLTRDGMDGQAHIARRAIIANTPKALLRELSGKLLADAAASGDPRSVRLVLSLRAGAQELNQVDAQGWNALHHAAGAAHREVFGLLVDAGLDPLRADYPDGKPLLLAVAAAVTRRATQGEQGEPPPQRFLERRKRDQRHAADALRYLIGLGLNANVQRRFPKGAVITRSQIVTPLQAAMRARNPLAVEALLEAGAKIAGKQQREFQASFAKYAAASFDDATVDALDIMRMLRRTGPEGGAMPSLHAAIRKLATRRWSLEDLEAIAPARRAAWAAHLNRALTVAPALLTDAAMQVTEDGENAFMLALRLRLPGVVAQLARAGAVPSPAGPAIPAALLCAVSMEESGAAPLAIAALDQRKAGALGDGWNALIARAMMAGAGWSHRAADDAKAAKSLWRTIVALRHAHQCEEAGIDGDLERRQRTALLKALAASLGEGGWDTQWRQSVRLLEAPSVFEALV
ncbi:MAG: hypothetical protein JWP38_614 [Herbaspirillum sp.]|nr:hypothetical protein [Herbaspirillum sp.]